MRLRARTRTAPADPARGGDPALLHAPQAKRRRRGRAGQAVKAPPAPAKPVLLHKRLRSAAEWAHLRRDVVPVGPLASLPRSLMGATEIALHLCYCAAEGYHDELDVSLAYLGQPLRALIAQGALLDWSPASGQKPLGVFLQTQPAIRHPVVAELAVLAARCGLLPPLRTYDCAIDHDLRAQHAASVERERSTIAARHRSAIESGIILCYSKIILDEPGAFGERVARIREAAMDPVIFLRAIVPPRTSDADLMHMVGTLPAAFPHLHFVALDLAGSEGRLRAAVLENMAKALPFVLKCTAGSR